MQSSIQRLAAKVAPGLPPGERVLLEAVTALMVCAGSSGLDAEALRAEVAARQGRPMTSAAFRQRLKRLNDSLKSKKAPFLLTGARRRIRVQQTADWEAEQRSEEVEQQLSRHSDEGTAIATGASIPPLARPDKTLELVVMFSYAWLNQGSVGGQQHRMQDDFYAELERQLKAPPDRYRNLPPLRLWRDRRQIRNSDQGDPQIDAACSEAFLGLLMMSDKYPHSKGCLREAAFFLEEDGRNKAGKHCIMVPVNIARSDAPPRFNAGTRIWVEDDKGRNLVQTLSQRASTARLDFVKKVAEQIFQAAQIYTGRSAPSAMPDNLVELFAGRWYFEHHPEDMVGPRARRARLGANVAAAADIHSGAEPAAIEIVPRLVEWACSPTGPRLTALLGEFGMGKTVACQLLTQELLSRRRDGDLGVPLPLYFDLRNIDSPVAAGSVRLEALIDDMLRRAGENPPPAAEVIAYLRDRGALVVFDGLDEVTNKLTTEQAIRLYRELLGMVPTSLWAADAASRRPARSTPAGAPESPPRGPRMLISCRTHFFPDIAAQRGFLTGMDRAGMSADEDIQTFLMLPFSPEQIEAYLRLHLAPDEAQRAIELINQTYDLRQLAERPILLRFVRETIGRLEAEKLAGRDINVARLYDILVDQTLARDDPKHVIPVHEKRTLLRRLAYTMQKAGISELSHQALDEWFEQAAVDLPRLARVLAGVDGLRQSEIFLQDLRNASLLVRPGESSFRFAHTSIREYFLADELYRSVCESRGETAFNIPLPSRETIGFLLARLEVAGEPDRRAFGDRFPGLITAGHVPAVRRLAFAIWRRSSAMLPRPPIMELSGLDFFRDVFTGAEQQLLPLRNSRWHGSQLTQSEFGDVDLSGADFSGVEGRMSHWLGCCLQEARFDGADLQGSTWRNLDLPSGLLGRANLRDMVAAQCRVEGAPWRPAPKIDARGCWPVSRRCGLVNSVALGRAGDRELVVAGCSDGVRLWDAVSGAEIVVLGGQGGLVNSVALGRVGDREVVVAGGYDVAVCMWDAVSGAEIAVLGGQGLGVTAVALGRAGDREVVAAGGSDGVRLWDAVSGVEIAVLGGQGGFVHSVALGRAGDREVVVAGGEDGVRLWDAVSGAEIAVLGGQGPGVTAVALGQAGDREVVAAGGSDGVQLWDAVSGAEIAVLGGQGSWVRAVALGRAGNREVVAAGGSDGVRLWDAVSGAEIALLGGQGGFVNSVALGRVGDREVVVAGGYDVAVRLWDAVSGAEIAALGGKGGGLRAVALGRAGDREVVAAGGSDGVRLWDAVSGAEIAVLGGQGGSVNSVALGRVGDRDMVAAGGSDGVRLWDAVSGTEITVLGGKGGGLRAVALGRAGDREMVVAGGSDGVRLWDAVSGAEIAVLGGKGGFVNSVALGRAGNRDIVLKIVAGAVETTDLDTATFQFGRTLIRGPGPETLLDLIPDGEGGYRLSRISDDAWRYWRAQGFANGRLVNVPIDDMPRA